MVMKAACLWAIKTKIGTLLIIAVKYKFCSKWKIDRWEGENEMMKERMKDEGMKKELKEEN